MKNKQFTDALDNILDRPIAFNPSFKKITGSTNAALLLSQAFYWTKRATLPDGWFWKTRNEWMEETGLTETELDTAREKCRVVGVIEEDLRGVPATLHYRVNKAKVYELLGFTQIPGTLQTGLKGGRQIPGNLESGDPENFNKESENTPESTTPEEGAPPEKNIFSIYEEEIGPLTPMIADALQDAEQYYGSQWVKDAIKEAVKYEARNWAYVQSILKRWKEQGNQDPIKAKKTKAAESNDAFKQYAKEQGYTDGN